MAGKGLGGKRTEEFFGFRVFWGLFFLIVECFVVILLEGCHSCTFFVVSFQYFLWPPPLGKMVKILMFTENTKGFSRFSL